MQNTQPQIVASFDIGAKNLAVCILDIETEKILDWFIINIFIHEEVRTGKEVKSSERSIRQHIDYLAETLPDYRHRFEQVTHVLLEQQPNGKGKFANSKMFNVENSIRMWFRSEFGIVAQTVSPKLKLQIIREALKEEDELCDPKPSTPKKATQRYAYHKKRAVQCARKLAPERCDLALIHMCLGSRKKDDYADSFLQGLWWIRDRLVQKEKQEKKLAKQMERERKAIEKAQRAQERADKKRAKLES
jgi:hypothetical protein